MLVVLSLAISDVEAPQFKSAKALEAQKMYSRAAARAESECKLKMLAAEKAYLAALTDAKGAATRGDDVDEALRIEVEIKALKEKIASDQPQASSAEKRPLVVERAILYADGLIRDETKAIQSQVHGDTINGIRVDDPDIKFGTHKQLILKLRYHGVTIYTTVWDDGYGTFIFGSDLGPWKQKIDAARPG